MTPKLKRLKKIPKCDICHKDDAEYEANTKLKNFPTAFLCHQCYTRYGYKSDNAFRLELKNEDSTDS